MLPSVVHLKAPADMDEAKLAAKAMPPPIKRRPRRKLFGTIFGVVVLLVAAFLGWQKFKPVPPPPVGPPRPTVAHPAAPAPAKPVTPSETLNKIASMPGDMIGRAQDAIAQKRENKQELVDALAADKAETVRPVDKPVPPVAPPPPPPEPTMITAESQTVIAPGVTATTTTVMATEEASAAFSAFVAELRINGVFQGSPAKALINGHTYREGELVNPGLGIMFDHIDADTRQIVFRDQSGATVARKY